MEDELSSVSEKYTHEIVDLKEQLKIKQVSNILCLLCTVNSVYITRPRMVLYKNY